MNATAALAATAFLVSLAFALTTLERWLARRRRHEAAWTVSLFMFSTASLAYWAGAATGWGSLSFRVFYLFGAILNVPFLALGTVYLLGGRRVGDKTAVVLALSAAFAAGVVMAAPLVDAIPVDQLPQGREVFGPAPRMMAAVGSGVGAVVVFAGAAWSAFELVTGRRPGHGAASAITPRRLASTNVLIALGTALLAAGGTLYSAEDEMTTFGIWLVLGVTILFAGFLVSSPAPGGPAHGPPAGLAPFYVELWEIATAPPQPPARSQN
ncbi:MAG: hypothetical protein JJLCMIEE_00567 [Acidimicrobiales bacterium]|nr:MAG: hypothetical protein EDR02_04405 [Actinomycetota bacterium]MBV6507518.1 hypothetical protein [Acidimicrobiales bacterium]RIK07891.1 MAG: hypothetical protein DCC48_02770 [Acidobacteriota bacterium]